MIEYIDIFKSQAKSLLKEYRAQNNEAKLRCQTVFGKKEDLSLMNMQHVIAKEYGFDSWNELQSANDAQQATALIERKNLSMQKPLRFYADDKGVAMFEIRKQKLMTVNSHIDFDNFQMQTPFGDFVLSYPICFYRYKYRDSFRTTQRKRQQALSKFARAAVADDRACGRFLALSPTGTAVAENFKPSPRRE